MGHAGIHDADGLSGCCGCACRPDARQLGDGNMTRIYASRIELMSRPSSSTVVAPAFRRSNIPSSLASRARAAAITSSSTSGLMTTMPSVSPTSQSPARNVTSPRAIVPPISPGPLDRPRKRVPTGEDRKFQGCQPVQVANGAVDDERDNTCRLCCRGEDLAPVPTRDVAGHSDGENASARCLRNGGMHGEVVPDRTADSECGTSEACARPHGMDAGIQALAATFAQRRASQREERGGNGRICREMLCHVQYANTS